MWVPMFKCVFHTKNRRYQINDTNYRSMFNANIYYELLHAYNYKNSYKMVH